MSGIQSAKIIISGAFGVGKTTLVGTLSEIPTLRTEARMTTAGALVDDRDMVDRKNTTTVALDFGRITIDERARLYLFGTPGQDRFRFMWDDLVRGALGAIVIADTRRLEESYEAIDYYEVAEIPFIVGINQFAGAPEHDLVHVRHALNVAATVPVLRFDARNKESAKSILLELIERLLIARQPFSTRSKVKAAGQAP